MSLYEDLPQARNASAASNGAGESTWAAPKLQPTFRKPTVLAPPPALLRAGRGGGRISTTLGRGPARTPSGESQPSSLPSASLASIFSGTIQDEYDPARPNEYEEVIREREQRKKEAQLEEERQARLREEEAREEEQRQRQQEAESSSGSESRKASDEERARALNISGGEAWMRRAAMSGRAPTSMPPPPPPFHSGSDAGGGRDADDSLDNGGSAPSRGMSLAKNLLQKMGWKEGEGLGRNKQGIAAPLVAQKTGKRGGIVVHNEPKPVAPEEAAAEKKARMGAVLQGTPSRVLCLRNMVGPGEVDEELEDEVGQECLKYGQVTSVLIFEVTTPGFAPEEAVRIFIKFDRVEATTKAMIDMQGRFFGGRQVRAAFFSEDRFDRAELAPAPGEFN